MPECHTPSFNGRWSTSSEVKLLINCFIALWIFADVAGDVPISLVDFSLVQSYCLLRYIQNAGKCITSAPKKATKYLLLCRHIQILNRYYNLVQQNGLIIAHNIMLTFGFIISFFTLISLGTKISFPEFLLFGSASIDGATVILICYSFMGQLHSTSKLVCTPTREQLLYNNVTRLQRKWIQRYTKSLSNLKSYVGDVNFVEELTPLVMLNFCIYQTASLLLLK
ncbi:unnamed protein product [Orchesella dallaii]|uniref:Uncharacterized protein n=1 Tax=Orchesella dallaii TaxID=48710 RepID=A0ABP1RJ45_9HEXA